MLNHNNYLGKEFKDQITDFIGTCTGILYNQFGAIEIRLIPRALNAGITVGQWFPIERIEENNEGKVGFIP